MRQQMEGKRPNGFRDPPLDAICARFMVLLALGLLLTALAVVTFAGERPDFTGEWRLNREQSEDLQQKMREALSQRENWLGRLTGGIFGSQKKEEDDEWRSLQPPTTLKIALRDPEFHLRDGNSQAHTLYTDGRKQDVWDTEGNAMLVTTRWIGQEIVSACEMAGGMKVKTLYAMARGGTHMFLTLYIEGPRLRNQVVVRYVYDFAAPVELLAR